MNHDIKRILSGHTEKIAPRLLGCELIREVDGQQIRAKIVETESYHQTDEASHSFRGMTQRNSVMFGEAGNLYVYFTYGMHYCCNIVTGEPGEGSAVLIRAVEPIDGVHIMARNRKIGDGVNLSNGPAKLCQAMLIDEHLNGHNLSHKPLTLKILPPLKPNDIVTTTRVGIKNAKDKPWRFYIKNNNCVSKK